MSPDRRGPGIDWEEVRARLARSALATREALRPTPEQARAILDERARALAQIPPRPPSASEVIEVATFGLADEQYAIETRHIRRVVRLTEATPVPEASDLLVGIINLRGEILAVFDLRRFFGVAAAAPTDRARVIVLGGDRDELGVLVDEARGVRTLRIGEVLDAPGSPSGAARQHLRGVTPEALIVLDGAALLRDPRLVIDQAPD